MNLESVHWDALARLRTAFLEGSAGRQDYWQTEGDLASYDQTFAQRTGWKWDYVLAELTRRRWTPPSGAVLDWGCGTGIASRVFMDHFGKTGSPAEVLLWDRSTLATRFAERRFKERFPHVNVRLEDGSKTPFETLLLSHVLTELSDPQIEEVMELAARSIAVLWVEPGTYAASRKLSELRERLHLSHGVIAPCTHQGSCPMLNAVNRQHWCHHFATPPAAIFTDGNWARFATLAGIDLRSLPLSFLILDKRPQPDLSRGTERIIGWPRTYKGYALILGCSAAGLHERRLTKRVLPDLFRQVKKGEFDPVQNWECDGDEIVRAGS